MLNNSWVLLLSTIAIIHVLALFNNENAFTNSVFFVNFDIERIDGLVFKSTIRVHRSGWNDRRGSRGALAFCIFGENVVRFHFGDLSTGHLL